MPTSCAASRSAAIAWIARPMRVLLSKNASPADNRIAAPKDVSRTYGTTMPPISKP